MQATFITRMSRLNRLWRYVWAAPCTAVGLAIAVSAWPRGRAAVRGGVIEVHGPVLAWALSRMPVAGGIAAVTFGHVVLACNASLLEWTRPHERVHVRQYEQWGALFVPAYVLASVWASCRGGHFYADNWFERKARRQS